MYDVIRIGTQTPVEAINERVLQEVSDLQAVGIDISTEINDTRFFKFVQCKVRYGGDDFSLSEGKLLSRHHIANALADIVVDGWQAQTLKWLLSRRFECFSPSEEADILTRAVKLLAEAKDTGAPEPMYQISRKSRVRQALAEYLQQENCIMLDGFLKFRLKNYCDELGLVLDKAVDQFLVDKEYKEFIRLLRNFVEILDPKVELVHLAMSSPNQFKILDEQGELLHHDYLEAVVVGDTDDEISYEDLLISALITLSPAHLVVHVGTFKGHLDIVDTLKSVFQARLHVCDDCDLCARLTKQSQKPESCRS